MAVKILAFAGSARKDSWNKKIGQIAAEGAREKGAAVTWIDLKDYALPLMDQDLEEASGLPENAKKLKKLFRMASSERMVALHQTHGLGSDLG